MAINLSNSSIQAPFFEIWLKSILLLFPEKASFLSQYVTYNVNILQNLTCMIARLDGMFAFYEEARPIRAHPGKNLPGRWVFRCPHVQIILYDPHETLEGVCLSGVLCFEIFDGVRHEQAQEGFYLRFPYLADGQALMPNVRATKALLRAYLAKTPPDYRPVQPFLKALSSNSGLTPLLRNRLLEIQEAYLKTDEPTKGIKCLEALLVTPVCAS